MRTDVHLAALKAAAKVAFSVVLLNGCSSGAKVATVGNPGEADEASNVLDGTGTGSKSPEDEAKKTAGRDKDAGKDNTKDAGKDGTKDAGKPENCEAILTAAFPTPGDYPSEAQWEGVPHSSAVVACCDAELASTDGISTYRWDCCVAFDPEVSDGGMSNTLYGKYSMACTPWGPPVPPSMTRRRGVTPDVAAWIEEGGRAVA
jgi:hypothetical protein